MIQNERFVFLLVDEFSHLAFANAVEPLRIANLVSGKALYSWSFASEDGRMAVCSNGSEIRVHHGLNDLPKMDRLFVLSGINMRDHVTRSTIAALRKERVKGTAIGALCSGAWLLAEAGFLNGMTTAIHWEYHDSFSEQFPEVSLLRNVFVADEKYITASGGSATCDLMLHLIEEKHGYDLSVAVADQMVYNAVRNATAEQRVSLQSRQGMRNSHLVKAISLMREQLETPVSPATISKVIGISSRQLERLFGKYLNTSPKRYYMELRLERARHLLIQTESSITEVAMACGFDNPGHFSKVYKAWCGVAPVKQKAKMG